MRKKKTKVKMLGPGSLELLKSQEVEDALVDVAQDIVSGLGEGYFIQRWKARTARAAVNIGDRSRNAMAKEAETGALAKALGRNEAK